MKHLNEVARMQQLAGINEIKIDKPGLNIKLIKKPSNLEEGKLLINDVNYEYMKSGKYVYIHLDAERMIGWGEEDPYENLMWEDDEDGGIVPTKQGLKHLKQVSKLLGGELTNDMNNNDMITIYTDVDTVFQKTGIEL